MTQASFLLTIYHHVPYCVQLKPRGHAPMVQITKDNAYDAVAPDDFPAMLEVERYGNRSTVFDKIISATHDHFWDPLDAKYIDFKDSFDAETQQILPDDFFPIF